MNAQLPEVLDFVGRPNPIRVRPLLTQQGRREATDGQKGPSFDSAYYYTHLFRNGEMHTMDQEEPAIYSARDERPNTVRLRRGLAGARMS